MLVRGALVMELCKCMGEVKKLVIFWEGREKVDNED